MSDDRQSRPAEPTEATPTVPNADAGGVPGADPTHAAPIPDGPAPAVPPMASGHGPLGTALPAGVPSVAPAGSPANPPTGTPGGGA